MGMTYHKTALVGSSWWSNATSTFCGALLALLFFGVAADAWMSYKIQRAADSVKRGVESMKKSQGKSLDQK